MKASEFTPRLGKTAQGLIKIALQSRSVEKTPKESGELVILANGPSLRTTIEKHGQRLATLNTMCVNFMANTPEFSLIRPKWYILADPHFFKGLEHENVAAMWRNLAAVDWAMSLAVPAKMAAAARNLLGDNSKVKVVSFNPIGIEGFHAFEHLAFRAGLGMPRPRNVLIPALMVAINAGYSTIYITGADHSWMQTIAVDDDNHVVSVQPHFYADSKKETTRSRAEYRGYRLHNIIKSFYVAFRSYHIIARYAESRGVTIYNATPGSFIDAFPRREF